ncbi:hypothetical protein NKDENANG_00751 [Candidatus Entotheonellaceae bacterium PAL068K]
MPNTDCGMSEQQFRAVHGEWVTERPVLHLVLHIITPGVVAWLGFPTRWQGAWLVMLLTMLVDLDHLLASPIYDPDRCSLGFHPLHTPWAIVVYLGLAGFPRTRLVGVGLVLHMALDAIDCVWIRHS